MSDRSERTGPTNRQIADAIVRVTRDGTGRGPVSARVLSDEDTIVVMLREMLTTSEQTLVENGRTQDVLAFRRALQDILRPAYVEEIRRITGRRVEAFMSTNSADPDRSAEIFVMGPPETSVDEA